MLAIEEESNLCKILTRRRFNSVNDCRWSLFEFTIWAKTGYLFISKGSNDTCVCWEVVATGIQVSVGGLSTNWTVRLNLWNLAPIVCTKKGINIKRFSLQTSSLNCGIGNLHWRSRELNRHGCGILVKTLVRKDLYRSYVSLIGDLETVSEALKTKWFNSFGNEIHSKSPCVEETTLR